MKTTNLLLALFITAGTVVHAQENTSTTNADALKQKQRIFGLGFKTSPLNLDELIENESVIPSNRVIITVNAHPHFRIQPEVGYYHKVNTPSDPAYKSTVNSISYGVSAYGMWQKERTVLYVGPKVSKQKTTDVFNTQVYNPNPPFGAIFKEVTNITSSSGFGLVAGGEYLLGKHFSVGAEVGALNTKIRYTYSESPTLSSNSSKITTETNLLFRFYF